MAKIGIVMGTFHKTEMEVMLEAALKAAKEMGLEVDSVVRVPGSYEKPLAIKRLIIRDDIDGVVALGIIERGETGHGHVMGQSVSDAIIALQLQYMKPVGIGILGPDIFPTQFAARLQPHAVAAVNAVKVMLS
jgi:6,7-dimethyl-8-ribityllumazine synthase